MQVSNNSVNGNMTLNGQNIIFNNNKVFGLIVNVSGSGFSTNDILTNNVMTSIAVNGGGGGVATDPLLIGNRTGSGVPVDIAPQSVGNI